MYPNVECTWSAKALKPVDTLKLDIANKIDANLAATR